MTGQAGVWGVGKEEVLENIPEEDTSELLDEELDWRGNLPWRCGRISLQWSHKMLQHSLEGQAMQGRAQ